MTNDHDEPTGEEREQLERDTHPDPEPGVRQDSRGEHQPDLPADDETSPGEPVGDRAADTTRRHREHAERIEHERDGGGDR